MVSSRPEPATAAAPPVTLAPAMPPLKATAVDGVSMGAASAPVSPIPITAPALAMPAVRPSATGEARPPVTAVAPQPVEPSRVPEVDGGCTAAQLRRFIKSRAYVPLHELRRRFELPGTEDDVSPVSVDGQCLFVGLPRREASLLGELLSAGDVGYELLLDPASPLVIGVFPMRPVPRS